jgi:hypothetical protein
MASQHLSIRLPKETFDRLDAHSQRSSRSRSETAKTLIEEGLRMSDHPGIVFRPGPTGRRAALAVGPDVWEVVRAIQQIEGHTASPVDFLAGQIDLSAHQIRVALRYYEAFPEEIDRRIALDAEVSAEMEADWRREQTLIHR